jgi:hypothetical protein
LTDTKANSTRAKSTLVIYTPWSGPLPTGGPASMRQAAAGYLPAVSRAETPLRQAAAPAVIRKPDLNVGKLRFVSVLAGMKPVLAVSDWS